MLTATTICDPTVPEMMMGLEGQEVDVGSAIQTIPGICAWTFAEGPPAITEIRLRTMRKRRPLRILTEKSIQKVEPQVSDLFLSFLTTGIAN